MSKPNNLVDAVPNNQLQNSSVASFWTTKGLRARWADPLFRKMLRNILLLAWSWSLGEGAFFIQISTTTLAATNFANRHLATIPIGCMLFVGTIWSVLLPLAIARYGYRAPLYSGACMGITGAAICIVATWFRIYWLLVVGASFLGGQVPCTLYYRLLALQFSTPEFAPKAIALVIAGGCLSSIIGPEIAKHTVNALPKLYSGAYLTTLCECTLLFLTLTFIQFPDNKKQDYAVVSTSASHKTQSSHVEKPRSVFAIASQRTFFIAALGGFVSWSAMATQMSATPLAMTDAGHTFAQATTAVEYHLLGMFVPSFFTGALCHWLGSRFVMFAGLLIQFIGAMLFQLGFQTSHFYLGLIIVGIGWNFGYVGASALLSQVHEENEKLKTHSLYEAIVMSGISIAFFSSAFLEQRFGWMVLTGKIISIYLAIVMLIVSLDSIISFLRHRKLEKHLSTNDIDMDIPA